MKGHYSLLDAIRFLAAFFVMNFHYFQGNEAVNNFGWYRYGNLGVQLFFIISGFVIVQSLQGKTIKEYAKGRFLRLFPLFWIICTATYLITLIVPGANPLHINEYLISMTMIGDIINGFQHNDLRLIDPSYWTLTVEIIFYIGIGIFVYLFSLKNIRYFLLTWLGLSMLSYFLGIEHNFYIKLALVRHASYFIFGATLALIVAKQSRNIFVKYFDYALLFISASYSIYIHPRALPALFPGNNFDKNMISLLHVIFFCGIVFLVYLSKYIKNPKIINILLVCGGLTYPLYLLHQIIGDTLINFIINNFNYSWNIVAIGFEAFIIIVAYFVFIQDKKLRNALYKKFF